MSTENTFVTPVAVQTVSALTAIAFAAVKAGNGNGYSIDNNEFKTEDELVTHIAMRIASRLGGGA